MKDSTRWLDIEHSVHELWEEPPPDLRQGPAGHDYVLYGVHMGVAMGGTQFTERAHTRRVFGHKLIAQKVRSEEFQMLAELFGILSIVDIMQGYVRKPREPT